MSRGEPFNLSAWAIDHAPLLRYLMVVLLAGGLFAFVSLGQDEDPPFTFRAMVVRAYWPGATATQMAEQVTDKLEKKLQETPGIDKIRSYSKPGETLIFVQVNEATRGRDVADAWYQVRKKIGDIRGTLPPERPGAVFQRRVRRCLRRDVRLLDRRLQLSRAEGLRRGRRASNCSRCRTSPRWICSACRTRRSTSSSRIASSRRSG